MSGLRTSLTGIFRAFPELARDRNFIRNVVALAMTSAAFFAFIAAAPFIVVETMGRGSDTYGAYFIINAFGYMVGNFAMSRLVLRHGTATMTWIGLIISFVAITVAFVIALTPWWTPLTLFLPLAISAIGNGLTLPGATAAALSARPELAGSAAGLAGAIQLGSGALATVAISSLVAHWPPALMAMMWLMLVVALLALRKEPRRRKD